MTKPIKALDLHDRSGILEGEMIISSSLRNRRRRRATPPPPCAKWVSGTLTPDVTGCYCFAGYHEKRTYYKHRTLNWYIRYYTGDEPANYIWFISKELESAIGTYWVKYSASYEIELGDYIPGPQARGIAKVENPPS